MPEQGRASLTIYYRGPTRSLESIARPERGGERACEPFTTYIIYRQSQITPMSRNMLSWMARDLETAIALLDDAEPLPARIAARPSSSDETRKDANQMWAYLIAVKRYLIGIRAQNENIVEDHAEEIERDGRTGPHD